MSNNPDLQDHLHTLTPTTHFIPPSVAFTTGETSYNNISGLSSFFGNLQSVMSNDTLKPFSPSDTQPEDASFPISTAQQEHQQQLVSRPKATAAVEPMHLPTIGPFHDHCCKIYRSFSGPPESSKNG